MGPQHCWLHYTAQGRVITQCRKRHRYQEYLGLLREIENNLPKTLDVHVIVDNYATHKHPRLKRRFAARPRFHAHYTPTYAWWLNQVEIWFNRITQQAIRRGTFRSVKELVEKIDHYVQSSNAPQTLRLDRHRGFDPRQSPATR